jgi:hypothetical protein
MAIPHHSRYIDGAKPHISVFLITGGIDSSPPIHHVIV